MPLPGQTEKAWCRQFTSVEHIGTATAGPSRGAIYNTMRGNFQLEGHDSVHRCNGHGHILQVDIYVHIAVSSEAS